MNEKKDNIKTQEGIGLFRIKYENKVKGSERDQNYIAGVIAYTSKEAVDTIIEISNKTIKGFQGMKVDEVSFEGLCHAMSDKVKKAVLRGAIAEGKVVSKDEYDELVSKLNSMKKVKKQIIPKKAK